MTTALAACGPDLATDTVTIMPDNTIVTAVISGSVPTVIFGVRWAVARGIKAAVESAVEPLLKPLTGQVTTLDAKISTVDAKVESARTEMREATKSQNDRITVLEQIVDQQVPGGKRHTDPSR